MVNWEEKYNEARKLADKINVLNGIYDKIVDAMHWDCMEYHPSDGEHDTTWFTDYEEDDWKYEDASFKKEIYEEVLAAIEKLAK